MKIKENLQNLKKKNHLLKNDVLNKKRIQNFNRSFCNGLILFKITLERLKIISIIIGNGLCDFFKLN